MRILPLVVLVLLSCNAVATEPAPPPAAEVTTLDTVLVSGSRTGPELWQVRKGDHVLWLLGTQSPLPKKLEWSSERVESVIAASQEVIDYPSVDFDAGVGPVRSLFLLPSLFKARRIPDDGTLRDVLPPELYARWSALKTRYMPRNRKVEEWRPIFAAGELYERAIEASGLRMKNQVWPVVRKLAKRHDVPVTEPQAKVTIEAPRDAIREFTASGLDDTACFATTLERLETDLGAMKARANAWADGNLDALRALPFPDQNAACRAAVLSASVSEKNGLTDLPQRVRAAWLASAEAALEKNASTFGLLPVASLLAPDGYLKDLRDRGYEVIEPE